MEIVEKSYKGLDAVLNRIYDNEEKLISLNSFFTKMLRKTKNVDEQKLEMDLLLDLKAIYSVPKAPFEYVRRNMTDLTRQFSLWKLDKVYSREFSQNFYGMEKVEDRILGTDNQFSQTNMLNNIIYVCKDVPKTETNIVKAKEIVRIAIVALEKKLDGST